MVEQKKVPSIRFKGFADDWEQHELSKLATMHARIGWQNLRTSEFLDDGDYMLITGTDFEDGGINFSKCYYVEKERYDQDKNIQISDGSILITKDGTLGKVAYVQGLTKPATLNAGVFNVVIKKEDQTDEKYLFQYLKAPFLMDYVDKKATGGTIKHLNQNILVQFPVVLPKKEEQKKVGKYLGYIDNLINLHQQKHDNLLNVKRAMLEKMFPKEGETVPEVRFKGFSDDWKPCRLKDFGKATGGTSIESEFSEDGIFKVISIGSYSEDSTYRDQGIRAIKSEKTMSRVLKKDDITMILNDKTASGNIIGRVLLIDESDVYVYNQRTEKIEIDKEHYDPLFLYEMLNAPKIRDKIIKQSQGNTQIYVNWTTISLTEYMIPTIMEQRKIGKHFFNLDNLITLHQRKVEKLKNIKKAMLEKMFV